MKASDNNNYFINLTEIFNYNPNVRCPFVSITMLLSYYDTYKNDGIIFKKYDDVSEITEDTNIYLKPIKVNGKYLLIINGKHFDGFYYDKECNTY